MHLRERIEELEPLLSATQSERLALQKQGEQQRQERSELLLRVFKDVNKFLGTDVGWILSGNSCRMIDQILFDRTTLLLLTFRCSVILSSCG